MTRPVPCAPPRCSPGYVGEYCHHPDPCRPGYCLNGGNCSVTGKPGSPACSCPLAFTGPNCQTPQNSSCYPNNPCAHQGTCTLLSLDKHECHCPQGWTGPDCTRRTAGFPARPKRGRDPLPGGRLAGPPPGRGGPRCQNDTDEGRAPPSKTAAPA
ncbi:notch homolog 2 N-terminal-like protein A [Anguilla rostrata]|uniref:notch homolog 2 N-terminal-like protein A n=1 Tax=Anguilla rostrata TaxID=7938 RepID=UPI0030D3AE7D